MRRLMDEQIPAENYGTKRSIMIVTFDFPPSQSSSGMLRTLAFARDLDLMGWDVAVLTARLTSNVSPRAGNEQLIPVECKIIRTRAFDAARHFSVAGKYPGILEIPDRYSSWIPGALFAALLYLRRFPISHVFSSYPIASAHLIGRLVAKYTGAKWIADFRDPMVLDGHPDTKMRRRAHRWVERETMSHCSAAVFTNDYALRQYREAYPQLDQSKFNVVENGYDESIFKRAEQRYNACDHGGNGEKLVLLHSGSLYPDHRDPRKFLTALASLRESGKISEACTSVVLRASGYSDYYREILVQNFPTLSGIVKFASTIDYVAAVEEALGAGALLIFQGASCNAQVPAKLYEYARCHRPILAFTDPAGATAATLRRLGVCEQANLDDSESIERLMQRFFAARRANKLQGFLPTSDVGLLSRRHRSIELANVLESTS